MFTLFSSGVILENIILLNCFHNNCNYQGHSYSCWDYEIAVAAGRALSVAAMRCKNDAKHKIREYFSTCIAIAIAIAFKQR